MSDEREACEDGRNDSAEGALRRDFGFDRSNDEWIECAKAAERGALTALGTLGGYDVLLEAGRGAQGVVYKAVQPGTRRIVALKVFSSIVGTDARSRDRFETEVRTAASLSHPNVVTVFGAEVIDGHPAIVMEWIDGEPIDRWADRIRSVDSGAEGIRLIVRMHSSVCDGVAHAHQRGVIHRDLKPTNILVDRNGLPRVVDFGLARVFGERPESGASVTGTGFLGTPAYAAPEQFGGDRRAIDTRSDGYALGAVLHRLLTGSHPYDAGDDLGKLIDLVRAGIRCRPSKENRAIPGELDWILDRAMAVEPERRYPTADALCADLVAFLEGRPVTAHPPTRTYLATKFVRRHRVEATLVTLVLLALVIGLFATTWQYGRTQDALKALGVQKGKAESSAVAARRMEALATQRAEEAEWQSYVSSLSAATMAMSAFERPLAERELRRIPESRRGWECEVLLDLIAERGRRVLAADKSAGHGIGRMLLAPDCARLWTTPEYVRNGAPVSPFVCWDLQGDRELGQWSSSPGDRDAQLVQSADQRRVIGFSKGRVRIWDVLTAQLVHDLTIDLPGVRAVAGHPRQNEFAIAFSLPAGGIGVLDGHALEESRELVWKYRWVGDGSERSRPASDTAPIVDALAYSPDGTWLACAGSSLFNVRDSATFEARYAFQASKMMGHLIAWDPRGQWLAHVDADSVVGLVNAQSWRTVHHLSAHEDIVTGIGYLEGGRVLVSAGRDATVRLWDVDKQRQLGRLMASAQVRQLCVDDHRRQVITIEGRNGIWQRDCSEVLRASPITGRLVGGGFLGDSSSAVVAVTSPSARVSVIDASTGAETLRLDPARRCTASWYSACVSPDRSKIAFVACEPRVHLGYLTSDVGGTDGDKTSNPLAWRATASSPEYAEAGRNASWSIGPEPIAFGKNGATVFVGSREGVVVAINSESGEIMARRVLDAPGVLDLDVAASRDLLAVVALSGKVVVLRSEGLAIVEEFFGREVGSPTAVAWIDNDRRLAIGRADGQVVAVDLGSRSIVRLDKSHAGSVSALEFLASASRLVSISLDGAIRVWDCARAECIVAIPARPGDGGYALIASPDSLSIGVGYSNGQWRVLKPESAGVADR